MRILLIEPHDDSRKVLSRLLARAGHVVETADSVRAAEQFLESGAAIDLLLTNGQQPDGTAWGTLPHFRREFGVAKAIVMTGISETGDLERSREAGFLAHLCKPVNLDEFLAAIDRAAETATPAARLYPLPPYRRCRDAEEGVQHRGSWMRHDG